MKATSASTEQAVESGQNIIELLAKSSFMPPGVYVSGKTAINATSATELR